ncbi:AI-2E family transporter [Pedobacter sp.]|uniref:AI-2E family transporter n=1 Tax=Pedobacter sp. TaxID=1411316 RepID=UPI003D7FC289
MKLQRLVNVFFLFALVVGILYIAREFLIPLALAGVLSMLFVSMCNWCEKKGMHRGVSAFLSVLALYTFVALVLFFLSWQLKDFASQMGNMQAKLVGFIDHIRDWINSTLGISHKQQKEVIKQSQSSGSGEMLFGFAAGVTGVLVNTVLVTVYLFLLLYYRSHLKRALIKMVPQGEESNTGSIVNQSVQVSRQYLGGMAMMIGMLWVMYGVGFSIVGVNSAIFFAVLCGLLEIVPFIGNLTGTGITLLAVTTQGGDSKMIIGVVVTYLVVQFIQTYVLEPVVVGKQVNINPLFTIIAIVIGEMIWGIAGMVLAIPILGMLKIFLDHVPSLKPYGFLIGGD